MNSVGTFIMQMLQRQESGPAVRTNFSTHELLPFRSGHAHPVLQRDTVPRIATVSSCGLDPPPQPMSEVRRQQALEADASHVDAVQVNV